MSVSYFVRYEGAAENADEFLRYYRERHAAVLARFPGIRKIILHTPIEWKDRFPVRPDRFMLVAQMMFDSAEDLNRALQSDARADARADFANFPRFQADVYHQAAVSEEIWARP
jgi:uncharacterized protein (TIGR02118 family)